MQDNRCFRETLCDHLDELQAENDSPALGRLVKLMSSSHAGGWQASGPQADFTAVCYDVGQGSYQAAQAGTSIGSHGDPIGSTGVPIGSADESALPLPYLTSQVVFRNSSPAQLLPSQEVSGLGHPLAVLPPLLVASGVSSGDVTVQSAPNQVLQAMQTHPWSNHQASFHHPPAFQMGALKCSTPLHATAVASMHPSDQAVCRDRVNSCQVATSAELFPTATMHVPPTVGWTTPAAAEPDAAGVRESLIAAHFSTPATEQVPTAAVLRHSTATLMTSAAASKHVSSSVQRPVGALALAGIESASPAHPFSTEPQVLHAQSAATLTPIVTMAQTNTLCGLTSKPNIDQVVSCREPASSTAAALVLPDGPLTDSITLAPAMLAEAAAAGHEAEASAADNAALPPQAESTTAVANAGLQNRAAQAPLLTLEAGHATAAAQDVTTAVITSQPVSVDAPAAAVIALVPKHHTSSGSAATSDIDDDGECGQLSPPSALPLAEQPPSVPVSLLQAGSLAKHICWSTTQVDTASDWSSKQMDTALDLPSSASSLHGSAFLAAFTGAAIAEPHNIRELAMCDSNQIARVHHAAQALQLAGPVVSSLTPAADGTPQDPPHSRPPAASQTDRQPHSSAKISGSMLLQPAQHSGAVLASSDSIAAPHSSQAPPQTQGPPAIGLGSDMDASIAQVLASLNGLPRQSHTPLLSPVDVPPLPKPDEQLEPHRTGVHHSQLAFVTLVNWSLTSRQHGHLQNPLHDVCAVMQIRHLERI